MTEQPLVSIIVPVCNAEQYVKRCLESLLTQTYSNVEIILVDAERKDTSGIICDGYAATDNRIKVIHKTDIGISQICQTGLDVSTGHYIIYISPYNFIVPKMIETMTKELGYSKETDMVTCDFYESGKTTHINYSDPKDLLTKVVNMQQNVNIWNTLVSRDFIKQHGISFKPVWLTHDADTLFMIRLLAAGARTTHVSMPLYHFCNENDHTCICRNKRKNLRSIKTSIEEMEKILDVAAFDNFFPRKYYAYNYAYDNRCFKEMNQKLFPDVRKVLLGGGNSNRYSKESLLARCMKYPPYLVWAETKVHEWLMKIIGR